MSTNELWKHEPIILHFKISKCSQKELYKDKWFWNIGKWAPLRKGGDFGCKKFVEFRTWNFFPSISCLLACLLSWRRVHSSETFGEGKDDGYQEIRRWKVSQNFYDRCLLIHLQKELSQDLISVGPIFRIILLIFSNRKMKDISTDFILIIIIFWEREFGGEEAESKRERKNSKQVPCSTESLMWGSPHD